jgi:hypothetical protein
MGEKAVDNRVGMAKQPDKPALLRQDRRCWPFGPPL